jgi:tryptophan halogenase
MTNAMPRRIVIAGGGTAGWMAAAALSRFLDARWHVTLVESEAIGTVGVGEATIPPIRAFNAGLGIDEAEFVRETQGSFKLGIRFDGWSAPGQSYIHAFGAIGRPLGLLPFLPYWLRHRMGGGGADFWDFSPSALAAAANRFGVLEQRADGPPVGLAHAYHFDAGLYARFLRRYAEARGVDRIEGRILSVERCAEGGDVAALMLDGDRPVAGDLFVDCTGFRGLLIGEALGVGYQDWRHWLPCDRAVAVPCERTEPLAPFTRATAREAGWQWRIPLQHRTGNGLVYSSAHLSDERAAETLLANLDAPATAEPRLLQFVTGMRDRAWSHNVVALGLSGGFLEPLESTSIHLIQTGIAQLLQCLPGERIAAASRDAFNRQMAHEFISVRDMLILHYHANNCPGDFWAACRAMAIPDSLAQRIALFREAGRVVRFNDELFTEDGWTQVMLGQGILPAAYHPLADQLSEAQLGEFLSLAATHARRQAEALPPHADFIAAHCAATPIQTERAFA